jgi:pimeloyl-ACP methyl ester carboxylesterase
VAQLSVSNRRAYLRADRSGVETKASARASEEFRRRFSEHVENQPYEVWKTFRLANPRVTAAMGFSAKRIIDDGFQTGTMAGWDVTRKLSRLRMRVLVLVGEYDHCVPACAREIHRALPHSRLVIAPGEGHMPMFENRDRFTSVLREFFDSVA